MRFFRGKWWKYAVDSLCILRFNTDLDKSSSVLLADVFCLSVVTGIIP